MSRYLMLAVIFTLCLVACNGLLEDDGPGSILPTPELRSPENGELFFYNDTLIVANVELKWKRSTYSISSTILVAEDTNFLVNLQELSTSGFDYVEFETEVLNDTTQYFWKVMENASPLEDFESSLFSEFRTFTVAVPDEISCYKCGTYNCVADVDLTDNGVFTNYTDVPLTISVSQIGQSTSFNINYSFFVGSYNLSTSLTANDYDDIYADRLSGVFYTPTTMIDIPVVGLSQFESDFAYVNDENISGSLTYTEFGGNFLAFCQITGSKQ